VIAALNANSPPHIDGLAFGNAQDSLKVESLLLLAKLMDDYVFSIQKWNAIDKKLSAWEFKAMTWNNNIFSIALDELENNCINTKEHRLYSKTIEKKKPSRFSRVEYEKDGNIYKGLCELSDEKEIRE